MAVEVGEQYQISIHFRRLLPSPQEQIHEGVFAAPLAAVHQIPVQVRLPFQSQPLKLDHIHPSFVHCLNLLYQCSVCLTTWDFRP